ncbi:hypothetical protein GUJ93_ZPchr0010g7707 [Zizania palustris]|uniref:STOP1/2-like C2H2-type zinc finger domain-containing protein n=1 Tax=Zizania palustris TaxID=103762 RepID=A0A8J5WFB1_ZIZPA|nr:hypothetical protein GUJ93_ZPchr0010g7707 [Zizania palustris]
MHEKHCGRGRWVCSCSTFFSRKDKLFGHVAVFDGHTPAMPPDEYDDEVTTADGSAGMSGSGQLLHGAEALNRVVDTDQYFSESMFDDFMCSDIKGSMDDERGYLPPMGLDSYQENFTRSWLFMNKQVEWSHGISRMDCGKMQ